MKLIGDVGGFNSAIILFPTFIMSFFSSRIFNSSVYSDMPKKKKHKKKNYLNNKAVLQSKLANINGQSSNILDQQDI